MYESNCHEVVISFTDSFLDVQSEEHNEVEKSSSVVANTYGRQTIHDLLNAPIHSSVSTNMTKQLNANTTSHAKPSKETLLFPPPASPQDIKPIQVYVGRAHG